MTHDLVGRQNGAAIRAFRLKEKLTVVKLAGYVGLHEQSLRNIENGRRPASGETLQDIARVLGVPVAAITRNGADIRIPEDAPETNGAAA
jgi:transcriptional regulator with XRE-family HTH domain